VESDFCFGFSYIKFGRYMVLSLVEKVKELWLEQEHLELQEQGTEAIR
jgi:hypothetical protein